MSAPVGVGVILLSLLGIGYVVGASCEGVRYKERIQEEARRDRCKVRCADLPVLDTKVVDGKGETCLCGVER